LPLRENSLSLSKRLDLSRYSDRLKIDLWIESPFLLSFHFSSALRNNTIDAIPNVALTLSLSLPQETSERSTLNSCLCSAILCRFEHASLAGFWKSSVYWEIMGNHQM
jgi:hypothetical protein